MSGPTLATLGIKVENGEIVRATQSLDSLTVAGAKSEAATQRLTRRMALLEIEARNMDASMGGAESRVLSMAKAWGAAAAVFAGAAIFHEIIQNSIEAQNAMAQLEAAVQSTGGVAGRTVQQLDDFSMAMQRTTTYSDEAVKGAQAMLLTFDKIRGQRFDQATQAVADLAARMGGDLQGAAVQVGKALQDPTTGLTALRRSGVSFSEAQIATIKTMYETNRVAEGQAVILKELEHQFGGSAAAARNTLGGALSYLKNQWGDLFEITNDSSRSIVDAINAMGDALPHVRDAFNAFFGGVALMAADAAISVEKLKASIANFGAEKLTGIGAALSAVPGGGGIGSLLASAGASAAGSNNDTIRLMEKQRDLLAQTLTATGALSGANSAAHAKQMQELSEAQKKFEQLTEEITQQTAKQKALNAVFGQSALTLQIVGIRQDEAIKNAKIATDLSAAQRAAVVALNHEYANQLVVAAKLDDAERERIRTSKLTLANLQVEIEQAIRLSEVSHTAQSLSPVTAQFGEIGSAVSKVSDLAGHAFAIMTTGAVSATTKAKELETVLASVAKHVEKMQRIRDTMDEAEKNAAAAQKFKDDMQSLWQEGAGRIAGDFVKSMSRGFEEVYSLAVKMMRRMEEEFKRLNVAPGGFKYDALKYGAAAIGGGLAGYGAGSAIGAAGGNAVQGALGGAASGAMAGAAFGPWGALAGGIAGAAAGLFGFGNAAKEAAKAMAEAQKSVRLSITAAELDTRGDTVGAGTARIHAEIDAMRKQVEDAFSGGGANSAQVRNRNIELARLNALEADRIRLMREAYELSVKQLNEDVQVQILRNNGLTEEADAIARAIDQERRFAELRKGGISGATLELLRQSEAKRDADAAALTAANALKEAADADAAAAQDAAEKARAQRQAVEDINVELLNAQGQTGAAADLQFQLDQQRRLDDALKTYGDSEFVTKLRELQQLQRDQRAAQGLIDSTRGPSGIPSSVAAVTAVSSAVTDRTALMLVDLTRSEVAILGRIEQKIGNGGVGGGMTITVHQHFGDDTEEIRRAADDLFDAIKDRLGAYYGNQTIKAGIYGGRVGR